MTKRDDDATDNALIDKYPGCEGCMYAAGGNRGYRKCECGKYEYPEYKPFDLLYGKGKCEYFQKDQ